MMDYITKNFLVISSIVTILAPSITIILLYSYLSVFNSNLIWVIEYSDVITLSFLCIVIIAVVTNALFNCYILIYSGWFLDSKLARNVLITASAITVICAAALLMYFVYFTNGISDVIRSGFIKLIIFSLLSGVSVILILYFLIILSKDWPNVSPIRGIAFLNILIIFSYIWGTTYGLLVKIDTKSRVEVKIRDSVLITDVLLVIFLSHHAVFADGEKVFVVPTSDVLRITVPQNKE
jgi:hypothetical protein